MKHSYSVTRLESRSNVVVLFILTLVSCCCYDVSHSVGCHSCRYIVFLLNLKEAV